jgi:hypothetical protein
MQLAVVNIVGPNLVDENRTLGKLNPKLPITAIRIDRLADLVIAAALQQIDDALRSGFRSGAVSVASRMTSRGLIPFASARCHARRSSSVLTQRLRGLPERRSTPTTFSKTHLRRVTAAEQPIAATGGHRARTGSRWCPGLTKKQVRPAAKPQAGEIATTFRRPPSGGRSRPPATHARSHRCPSESHNPALPTLTPARPGGFAV